MTPTTLKITLEAAVADDLDRVVTWNAAMMLSEDLAEAGRANIEKRAPVFRD
jgi:enoyl-CoA hydratase